MNTRWRQLPPQLRRRGVVALSLLGLASALVVAHVAASDRFAYDAHAYWLARPYDLPENSPDAFVYSPPVLIAFRWLGSVLPWPAFLELYELAIGLGIWLLAGPFTPVAVFAPPVASELLIANIHVFLALVAVAGLRRPWLWALPLLTKVTPGIGLIWFAVRGEWRSLGIALGATAALALPTIVLAPDLWRSWLHLLSTSTTDYSSWGVPLIVRMPAAAVLVAIGARRDWRWTVPLGCMIALPVLWQEHSLSMLLGVLAVARGAWVAKPAGSAVGTRRAAGSADGPDELTSTPMAVEGPA